METVKQPESTKVAKYVANKGEIFERKKIDASSEIEKLQAALARVEKNKAHILTNMDAQIADLQDRIAELQGLVTIITKES